MDSELVSRVTGQLDELIKQVDALGLGATELFEVIKNMICAKENPKSEVLELRGDVTAIEFADLVEELSTMAQEFEHEHDSGSLLKKVRSFIPSPCPSRSCSHLGCRRKFSPSFQNLSVKLVMTALRFNMLIDTKPEDGVKPSELKPQVESDESHGRENDKKCLLELLLAETSKQVEVISIVGPTGRGKTTLARLLFDDDSVKRHFHFQVRTSVLDETKAKSEFLRCSYFLKFHVGKKVLFVLNDVKNEETCASFKDLLNNCAPGSKILLTTTSEAVAKCSDFKHRLGKLSKSDCWSVLQGEVLKERQGIPKKMIKIGKKIARSCKGSPQTAKIVGMMLRGKHTAEEWQHVLDTGIGEMKEVVTRYFMEFYNTYSKLSPKSKLCLWYCASFPRDHVINVEQLIRLWMAEGYLGEQNAGIECFTELKNCGIFIKTKDSIHKDIVTSCKIQAAAHEFIKSTVYYCSVEKFRSCVSFSNSKIPKDLFRLMKRLRALVLSSCQLEQLPSEAEGLSLLQYLDLSHNPLKELPAKIHKLSSLQFLDVSSCYELSDLPTKIGEVKTLHHLRVNYTTDELHNLPQGFENLTSLRTLDVVRIGGRYDSNVRKLKVLNDLEDIRITVHGEVNFPGANLKEKAKMKNLELCFVEHGLDPDIVQCIDKLEPPPQLEMLKIDYYPGLRLPKWILGDSLIKNLKRLSVRSGSNISSLSGLWKLTCLEFLWICDFPRMECFGHRFFGLKKKKKKSGDDEDGKTAFPCLKTLRIEHLRNWETWQDIDEADADVERIKVKPSLEELIRADDVDAKRIKVMPMLNELIINDCPKLKAEALPRRVLGKMSSLKITIDDKPVHLKSDPIADIQSSSRGKATEIEPQQC